MTHSVFKILSLVFNLILLCNCGRILVVIPSPSISHQVVYRPLTQELAKRGHDVVCVTTDPAFPKGQAPAHFTEIDIHDISYRTKMEEMQNFMKEQGKPANQKILIKLISKTIHKIFENIMNITEFRKVIYEDNKFDLVIIQGVVRLTFVLPYILKAPVIAMNPLGAVFNNYKVFGVPTHPILYPALSRRRLYNLTLWEKATEIFNHFDSECTYDQLEQVDNEAVRRMFGPDIPPLSELEKNLDMLFINVHPIFEGNFPVPPGVIHTWGIHKTPQKELPQDILKLNCSLHKEVYNLQMRLLQRKYPYLLAQSQGDQWYNAEKYVHLGIGIKLSWETITEEQIRDAIETVIKDESYRKNIKKLNIQLNDQPMTGLERAVWWTEYVMRHGGAKHLRAPAANISWAEYLELELALIVFLVLVFIISVCVIILFLICRLVSTAFGKPKIKVN